MEEEIKFVKGLEAELSKKHEFKINSRALIKRYRRNRTVN